MTARSSDPPLPTVAIAELWHRGTLHAADKQPVSREGHGLSVCRQTDLPAWQRIACLGDAPTWRLTRSDGHFLDAHSRTDFEWAGIERCGVQQGLIEPCPAWTVTVDDDELGGALSALHLDRAAAEREAELLDDPEVRPVATRTFTSTAAMNDRLGMISAPGDRDHLLVLHVEAEHPDLDGVWWQDTPGPLSAPRGVILPGRLTGWAAHRVGG